MQNLRLIPPSPNDGEPFSAADLMSVGITQEMASRIIQQATGVQPGGAAQGLPMDASGIMALLAALLKTNKKNAARYNPLGFGYAAYARQQMFAENPARSYLLIQNVGSGDLMVVFETASSAVQDLSADTAQLTNQQLRAVRIVAGGYFEPLTPPTNPITLFTLGTGTQGVAIEGSAA